MSNFQLFIEAIKNGKSESFDKFFQKDFLEKTTENKWRPIHFACKNGHTEIVKKLQNLNCDIMAQNENNQQPIHLACVEGHTDIVKLLINQQNIEAYNKDKLRPIHFACQKGHLKTVKLLIDKNCNIEACTKDEWRPIHFACQGGHIKITKLLIERGCKTEILTKNDDTPMKLAKNSGIEKLIKILTKITFLQACKNGSLDIVISLLNEANIEDCDNNKMRPIHLASKEGHTKIVKLLIDKCDIEACSEWNMHPIHHACQYGHEEIVKLLIDKGCNIEACNTDNCRPIHLACRGGGHAKIVKLLVNANCIVNVKNKFNDTPLELAEKSNNTEIIESLKSNSKMELKCPPFCDHKFCSKSLRGKKFQKIGIIGKGGFGKVYKYQELGTDNFFAMKKISANTDVKYIEEDIEKHIDSLRHERIVQYFCSLRIKDSICLFMEYLPKGSLQDKINEEKSISEEYVIIYSKQILEGLKFLHEKHIIHRDLKPSNILIDNQDDIKLTDFGLSRLLIDNEGKSIEALSLAGTCCFMAPEIEEQKPYKKSADIWSLAITVIYMIIGKISNINKDVQTNMFISNINTSEEMKTFIEKMLVIDPESRTTAAQLLKMELFKN